MRLIKKETKIDFLGKRRIGAVVSTAMILISLASLIYHGGPNYGIDFRGGTIVQLKFKEAAPISQVRKTISGLDMGDFNIQRFGEPEDLLVRLPRAEAVEGEENPAQTVEAALREEFGEGFTVERVEMVGPKVGSDLREKALLALFYSLAGILIYITLRFELRFGVAAIIALIHDTIITVGAFSIMDKEFTLPVVAALLTVIGYSLNDTIVVFDRIRENLRLKRGVALTELLNISINQTLSRTLLTSGTTLIVVLSIFFFGGEVIHNFSFALLVGIAVGTYSSIFVASPLLLLWSDFSKKKGGKTQSRQTKGGKRKAKA